MSLQGLLALLLVAAAAAGLIYRLIPRAGSSGCGGCCSGGDGGGCPVKEARRCGISIAPARARDANSKSVI